MQQSERMEDWAARQDNSRRREAMIEHLARLQNEQQRAESVCADLPEAHFDLAFALQLQAARAMPELRVWAASNPALDTQNFVNELARWEEYRRIALPWLQAAAEEGDLAALIVLARIHGDSRRPGPQTPPFRQIDDAAFVHYANVLERRGVVLPRLQSAASEARNRLDADTLARVQDMTDALAAKQPSAVPDDAAIRQAMRRSFSDTHEAVDCDPR
jgi:hypothetical protein